MTEELRFGLIKTLSWMIADIDYRNQVDLTDDDKDLLPKPDSPELVMARKQLEELEGMKCST